VTEDHDFAVSAESVLQKIGEFTVAPWHVAVFVYQTAEDVNETAETFVYVLALDLPVPLGPGLLETLTACQVNECQLAVHDSFVFSVAPFHLDLRDQVRSAAVFVVVGAADGPVVFADFKHFACVFRTLYVDHG